VSALDRNAFEVDLRTTLADAEPSGMLEEWRRIEMIVGIRS
jgi:hypothetical protein